MTLCRILALSLFATLAAAGIIMDAAPAAAQCSVFQRRPCNPTGCSVLQPRPCIPEVENTSGQDLRLTIESKRETPDSEIAAHPDSGDAPQGKTLDSIRDLFGALRACWVPPPREDVPPGMQMSVRLSFKRSGEIIGTPRVTYTSPKAPSEARERYHRAITEALERCTPMHFTTGLGGAVAGRPIAIRYVDNRQQPRNEARP